MPDGIRVQMNLYEVAEEIGRRLTHIFLKDAQGKRPCTGLHENSRKIPIGESIPVL